MNKFRTTVAAFTLMASAAGMSLPSFAQSPSFASAEVALEAVMALLGDETVATTDPDTLRRIKEIFEEIINDFPASDLTVQIILQDTIGNLDIAAFDRRLAELPASEVDAAPEAMTNVDSIEQTISEALEEQQASEADKNAAAAIGAAEARAAIAEQRAAEQQAAEQQAAEQRAAEQQAAEQQAAEQQAIEEARRSATNFNPTRFSLGLRPMATSLNQCYVRARRNVYTAIETVNFSLGGDGRLEGVPELLYADKASRAGRMVYVNITAALNECDTFQRRYANRRYEATFNGTELIRLEYATPPVVPWVVSSEDTQKELHLKRPDIAEIQARLIVLEFDPNGIDGIFGRGTRGAISTWQEASEIPVSGYLDERQLAKLKEMSEDVFQVWLSTGSNQATLDRASTRPRAAPRAPSGWWRDRNGRYCRRAFLGSVWCQTNRPRR